MKRSYLLFVLALLIFNQVQAKDSKGIDSPFEPVLAADQKQVTIKTLSHESAQYRFIGDWLTTRNKIKTQSLRKSNYEKEYKRMQKLFDKKQASKNQLLWVKNKYNTARFNLKQLQAKLKNNAALAEIEKWKIKSYGNPGSDYRIEFAQAMKRSYAASNETIKMDLNKAIGFRYYTKFRRNNGETLLKKGVISKAEYDKRLLLYQISNDEVLSAQDNLDAVIEAEKALDKSINIL